MTEAGGDYYYSYGPGLFIVLNTNNYNVAEHEQAIQKAVANFPDTKWRIVTIHQDIYGSGLDHSDTDGMILRTQLTPVFDKYDIDVVFRDMTIPTAVPKSSMEMESHMALMNSDWMKQVWTMTGIMLTTTIQGRVLL